MAAALSQSDTNTPFSDCSITFLLPRTLGSSFSAGAATLDSDDLDYVSSLFNSTAVNNSTQLLEHAKMVSNINCSSIPNASFDDRDNILANRSHGGQIELQGKRSRQRRPGLPGVEREGHVFNFSAKTTTVEFSQMGTSDSQSWPVIDYSCLQHISDPIEYFSTYRMLENAEKEVNKLKGEDSPMLNQPHRRRDRQRRPGLPDLEGKQIVFKFPGTTGTVEDSQIKNFTQSNGASITDLTIASKEISQIMDSQTVEPESKLAGNAETCDSNVDKEIAELDMLLSKCRELDNDGISNFVKETLKINPIHVENSSGLLFSVPRENKFKSPQLSHISSFANRNKIDGLSNSKGRLSLIIPQGDPFFPHESDRDKQSDRSAELGSNCKVFCDDGLEKLPSSERGIPMEDPEKLMSDCSDISVDGIVALDQETLKTKLFDAEEMTDAVDRLLALKKPIPLMDVEGRLAHISTLKRHLSQSTIEGELLMFSYDDLEDSLISKSQEMHSLLPVDETHLDVGSMDAQNACIPVLSNLKRLSFEDKMHSPVAEISEEDKNLGKRKISDPIGCQITLLEDTCQKGQGTVSDEEFASIVHHINFEEAGQSSASVDHRLSESLANHSSDKLHQPFVNTDAPEQILQAEAPEDDSLPENPAMFDEQMKASCEVLNGRNKNQKRSKTRGGFSNRKLEREEPPRKQRKRNSNLRKSLTGAGCVWESGVRRSTRIKVKPLQYWCGERFLYGRVHDSLTTVIGVKKFETPLQKGRKTIMKVKSYVSEEYADLVAQAALH